MPIPTPDKRPTAQQLAKMASDLRGKWIVKHSRTIDEARWRIAFLSDMDIIGESGEIDRPLFDEEVRLIWDWKVIESLEALSRGEDVVDLASCPINVTDWPSFITAMEWVGIRAHGSKWVERMKAIAERRRLTSNAAITSQ